VYQAALEKDTSYAATLSRSLSLVLDEFYQSMRSVGVSAVTGEGMTEFFQVSVTLSGASAFLFNPFITVGKGGDVGRV
jgi:hypothetical protein